MEEPSEYWPQDGTEAFPEEINTSRFMGNFAARPRTQGGNGQSLFVRDQHDYQLQEA